MRGGLLMSCYFCSTSIIRVDESFGAACIGWGLCPWRCFGRVDRLMPSDVGRRAFACCGWEMFVFGAILEVGCCRLAISRGSY
eukprot:jgi/Botrbrau1/4350/Bobra.0232s0039.1